MGVKQFYQLFDGVEVSMHELNGKTIAVDAMTEIYRATVGMPKLNTLTDSAGHSTNHINTILTIILKFLKNNIKLIYVFDSPISNEYKTIELIRREERKQMATECGNEKQAFRISAANVNDIITLLTLLGIQYTIAPTQYDAEHICAKLNYTGIVDYILTTDADAFMYGGLSILKYEKRKLINYTREMLKTQLSLKNKIEITDDHLLRIGVCLGTDYCDKTKGLGIKTVVGKCMQTQLTPDQENTIRIFKSDPPVNPIFEPIADRVKLLTWLESKSFNRQRMEKLLL